MHNCCTDKTSQPITNVHSISYNDKFLYSKAAQQQQITQTADGYRLCSHAYKYHMALSSQHPHTQTNQHVILHHVRQGLIKNIHCLAKIMAHHTNAQHWTDPQHSQLKWRPDSKHKKQPNNNNNKTAKKKSINMFSLKPASYSLKFNSLTNGFTKTTSLWTTRATAMMTATTIPRRRNAQMIHICHINMTSLKSTTLHNQPLQKKSYFMPLCNRINTQVLAFLQPCDLDLRSISFKLQSFCKI